MNLLILSGNKLWLIICNNAPKYLSINPFYVSFFKKSVNYDVDDDQLFVMTGW